MSRIDILEFFFHFPRTVIFVLAISIFFLIKYILNYYKISNPNLRKHIAFGIVIFITPLVFIGIIILLLSSSSTRYEW